MNVDKCCEFCKKTFSTKQSCNIHKTKCKIKDQIEQKNKIEILKDENKKLKEEIIFLKSIIENNSTHQDKISKQVNNTQNNITIFNTTTPNLKDLISNLEPIDFEEMKNRFENDLSNKYIDKGIEGIARFICDIPCNNKIFTTDYSRKVITYKTQEHIIVDPKGSILLNTALKQNADTIIDKTEDRYNYWKLQVKEARDDEIEPDVIDIENKKHTKKLLKIASKAKQNVSVSPVEATNIFVMKGIENKNYTAIE